MKCPFCKVDNDKVIDSRSADDGMLIRRRRHCQNCDKRFSTREQVVEMDIRVVKKDGAREPFSQEKIRRGLETACWKRPIPTDDLESVFLEIVQEIYLHPNSEIESEEIGKLVMEKLIDLDEVAYIRFASVYRQFKDIHDFIDEVNRSTRREERGKAID